MFNFDFWGGATSVASLLEEDEFDTIEYELEELYPDGLTNTEINDIFWFDEEFIAECLGYESFDEFWEQRAQC